MHARRTLGTWCAALVLTGTLSTAASVGAGPAPAGASVAHASVSGQYSQTAVGLVPTPDGAGYWIASSAGGVFTFGDARFFGSAGALALNDPVVGLAAAPDGHGYWMVASDGGIFSYGDARFFGSAGGMALNDPVVGMTATPDGGGYWLVASDGGIFAYGDALFYGSTGAMTLNKPIVGMTATPDGHGYWLVASDGGIFSFGDARFYGSTGALVLDAPVVGMTATPDGGGYWLVASDGGIFSFGDARFYGSTGGAALAAPVVGMAQQPRGGGYWLVGADGTVYSYGSAGFAGSAAGDIPILVVNQVADLAGARQAVIVDAPDAASTTATLYTFENDGQGWYQVFDPLPAVDGANGWIPGPERQEGDNTTPEGIYPFANTMYGTQPDPGVRYDYHQLVCGDWWDEDSADPGYNTFEHVACGTTPPYAASSEALWTEGNAYPSMVPIDFNTPPAGPLGSGIFLHADIGSPTQGCVSLPYDDLIAVLRWLNPALDPVIVMGPDSVIRGY